MCTFVQKDIVGLAKIQSAVGAFQVPSYYERILCGGNMVSMLSTFAFVGTSTADGVVSVPLALTFVGTSTTAAKLLVDFGLGVFATMQVLNICMFLEHLHHR